MLGQHIINDRSILVALAASIGVEHLIDRVHKGRAVSESQLLDQEVVLDGLKLCFLGRCNCGCVCVVNRWSTANRHLGQQIHIRRHAALAAQIFCVCGDQIVAFSHKISPSARHYAGLRSNLCPYRHTSYDNQRAAANKGKCWLAFPAADCRRREKRTHPAQASCMGKQRALIICALPPASWLDRM